MNVERVRRLAAVSGVAGPVALLVYFTAPAAAGWPYSGAAPDALVTYARSHESLFYAGAWLQTMGTLLSLILFLALVQLAGAAARLSGLVVIAASSALFGLVLVEGALLVAVPIAAASGDAGTVATTFALSNGAFLRVFPVVSAACYAGLGATIRDARVLSRRFGSAAWTLAAAFALAGAVAVVSPIGLIITVVLSAAQALWIVAAAVALWRV